MLGNYKYKDEMGNASDESKIGGGPLANFCATLIEGPTEKHGAPQWDSLDGGSATFWGKYVNHLTFKHAIVFMIGHRGERMVLLTCG